METVTHTRKLDEVQRGVETALRNFSDRWANGSPHSEPAALERIDKIGSMSALAIVEASETTATDIKAAAQAAVDIAAVIMNEAEELASDLRANSQKISEHLREFAALAKKVSIAMRNTRAEALTSNDDDQKESRG